MAQIGDFCSGESLGFDSVQTFERAADRERLSAAALKGFRTLAERWKLTKSEAAALLDVSDLTWHGIEAGDSHPLLSRDQLVRVSFMIGIYQALHTIFADAMADRWPKLPNRNPVFRDQSPVVAMIKDGIPLMLEARRHVEAMQQGS